MSFVVGRAAHGRWKNGVRITRKDAIEAHCYACNGGENKDCGGEKTCPLYQHSPFGHRANKDGPMKAENWPS